MDEVSPMVIPSSDITAVILAGGRGSRLGGVDKGLVVLHGRPLIEHVIAALQPQVGRLLISANRNREIYATYDVPVVADGIGEYLGPLAGMLGAMRAATTGFILSVPCDTPAPPPDLAARLCAGLRQARTDVCIASVDGRIQPVFALLRCTLADRLQEYLESGGRGVGEWMQREHAVVADFSDAADAFVNINTAEELQRLQEATGTERSAKNHARKNPRRVS